MDLGLWLLHAERRCSRVANLKARLDRDRETVISMINQWKLKEAGPGRDFFLMLLILRRKIFLPLSYAGVVTPPDSVGKRTP